jgi:hypothetical protein
MEPGAGNDHRVGSRFFVLRDPNFFNTFSDVLFLILFLVVLISRSVR